MYNFKYLFRITRMAFFRKKEQKVEKKEEAPPGAPKKPQQSLQEIVRDRVLTAEGWQRRTLSKAGPKKSK
jgi:hypothetical protein